MKEPPSVGQTVPLTRRPPHETIVWAQCDNSGCVDIGKGVQAAAQALGWTYKVVNYQSANPQTLLSALKTALQYHPVAVAVSSVAEPTWSSVIPTYEAAGVKLLPAVTTSPISSTVPTVVAPFTQSGRDIAKYFIEDANGKGHALTVDLPGFPVLLQYTAGFNSVVKASCPGCSTTAFHGTFAQLDSGQFIPAIVTALRKDPSINYVVVAADLLIPTLPSALKAAGLSNVKILGGQPSSPDVANIKSGAESAATQINNIVIGWTLVDAAARESVGMKPNPSDVVPNQLLTKANVSSTDEATYGLPPDYQGQFEKLWKIN
jgi:ribose transport system substrate-binding protein